MPNTLTKQQQTNLIIAIVVLALILLGIMTYNYYKNKNTSGDQNPPPIPDPGKGNTSPPAGNDNFPLQIGSVGPNVKYLQGALNRIATTLNKENLKVTEDGIFGQKTKDAIYLLVGTNVTAFVSTPTGYVPTTYITYPMPITAFNEILRRSRANQRLMGDRIYTISPIYNN